MDVPLSLGGVEDKKHFRLLELPAELLETILARETNSLELKSSYQESGQTDQAHDAVLCSRNTTYKIRQKNSSNSVWLLQRSETPRVDGVVAVAQCTSTLELSKQIDTRAIDYLRRLIPLYSSTGATTASNTPTLRQAFDAIPASQHECELACTELAIAAHPESSRLLRPSAQLKINIWRAVLDAALAKSIAESDFGSDASVKAITSEMAAVDAVLAIAELKAMGLRSSYSGDSVDPSRCTRWLGVNLLEVEALRSTVSLSSFISKWQDLLPEAWRSLVDPGLLAPMAVLSNGGKSIRCNESEYGVDALTPAEGGATNTAKTGQKRNWHEKFRPTNR